MNGVSGIVQSAEVAETPLWPDGETQVAFIIGDPVAQVKSPAFLTANLAARGINAVVVPGQVASDAVEDFVRTAKTVQNMPGVIVTVPHKQKALTLCDDITERARMAGSVNVLRKTEAGWLGDNTDGMGYLDGIAAAGGNVAGKRVLLVGAGGAGSAVAYEFLVRGAAQLAIHDIDAARRDALIARLETAFAGKLSIGSADPTGFDIVANVTPLGMRSGDPMPVDTEKLDAGQFAACAITKPDPSPFIAAARAKGCTTMPGHGMFKAQEDLLVAALFLTKAD